jgi:hypothetical protein
LVCTPNLPYSESVIMVSCDEALMTILGMLMSNIVLTVDTRAHELLAIAWWD